MSDAIREFRGDYFFLSNFYPSGVERDRYYPTAEHAYQASKTLNKSLRVKIAKAPTPGRAKALGRRVPLRENWDAIKIEAMREVLRLKFEQNDELREKLINTYSRYLEEGNNWGDTYWGTVAGKGENNLGSLLMELRAVLWSEDYMANKYQRA